MVLGHDFHIELGRIRAMILATLATLCLALVWTSVSRMERLHAKPLPQAAGLISNLQVESAGPESATPPQSPTEPPETVAEIETLANVVAKKYRVSAEATREVIGTAYGEGHRLGLDPLLILAVISIESRFNPIARSEAGAMGLMQIIPDYHKQHFAASGGSVLDPWTNIHVGTIVLKDYIQRAGTEIAGLQRYNGASDDASNAYANKVLGEKMRLKQAIQRVRDGLRT